MEINEGVRTHTGAWSNRNFRRLWTGFAVSSFGSEIAELAVPLLALITLSATATEASLLRMAQFLPFLLATLPLGVLVDRRRHRLLPLMIGADLGRFLLVAAIPVAVWLGFARIELLYALIFATGALTVLYQLADFAFLPGLVRAGQLVDANGKIAAVQSASEIGGRGLGGLLIDAISAPVAVAVNAAAFLGSAFSLQRIRTGDRQAPAAPPPAAPGPGSRSWRETVEGLRLAVGNRYVRALLGEATTFNLFNEMFLLGLMLHAVRGLHLSAAQLGLVLTAGGVGSFAGAWFGSRVTGRFGYGRVLLATLILGNSAPLGVIMLGRERHLALALLCAIFVVMGVGIGIANVHAVTLRQTALPARALGRVNAAYRLISWGAIPVGAAIGGAVATQAGAVTAMVAGAAGIASATLWVACSAVPRLVDIDQAAAARPQP